jgi:hypothetical protein
MKLLFASPEIGIFQLSLLLNLDLLCMLLSVIRVLGDEVSTPKTLQILCYVWYGCMIALFIALLYFHTYALLHLI